MFRPFSYVLLSALLTFSPWRTASAQQEPVTTFAAASLSDALNSIGKTFTNQTGVAVRFSFASSAVLAKQIDQGAPADVFASADVEWMEWAQARNLIKPQTRIGPGRFLSFLQGDAARAVFASQGFALLSPARFSQ
jgi:molybdate transport system substrate-binding protein